VSERASSNLSRVVEALREQERPISYQFEWAVIGFAAGIALYFVLPWEPQFFHLGLGLAGVLLVLLIFQRSEVRLRGFAGFVLILYLLLGLTRSTWHTRSVDTSFLSEGSYTVQGWIEGIEKAKNGTRWRVKVTDIEGYKDIQLPYRVRVNVRKYEGHGGDFVRFSARLSPPAAPVMSNAYDPARRAYFDRISATGFIYGPPEIIANPAQTFTMRLSIWLAKTRFNLADRIMVSAPDKTAGLQVALLTGVRTYIPNEQVDNLRASGLAHVLAISGLHMGLLAGGAYSLASLLFAFITPLSRRYDMRKAAAVIGAFTATYYLILSGASVATQRAYIMAIIIFLAVVLDRRAFSLRSVSLAALVTLVLHPESLMSAGFQMSFAAVTALVVVYQYWDSKRDVYAYSSFAKLKSGFSSLSVTSFVAGLATSGFAVFHFGRMAKYGLIGNLLAMPVFSLIVMPAALVTFISLPFGAEFVPLQIMSWGLVYVLFIAEWVASLSDSLVHVKSAPSWLIAVYALSFVSLCLGCLRTRIAALALMMGCFFVWALAPIPDIRVSEQGRLAIWENGAFQDEGDLPTLWVSSRRADAYGRDKFMERAGIGDADIRPFSDDLASCDSLVCRLTIKNKTLSVLKHPSEVDEACGDSDIVVLTTRFAGPVSRRKCKALLIDGRTLSKSGAQDIYIKDNGIEIRSAVTEARKNRPWGQYQRRFNN